jgi:hypothetical protein
VTISSPQIAQVVHGILRSLLEEFNLEELLTAGFDSIDLSNIFDDNLEVNDDELDIEKELKEAEKTDIKQGDRFSLGMHTLICGDSTDRNIVAQACRG